MPVLVDSGFRRGTDICKALALGANAVCVGRPYIWGLGAFGEAAHAGDGAPRGRNAERLAQEFFSATL